MCNSNNFISSKLMVYYSYWALSYQQQRLMPWSFKRPTNVFVTSWWKCIPSTLEIIAFHPNCVCIYYSYKFASPEHRFHPASLSEAHRSLIYYIMISLSIPHTWAIYFMRMWCCSGYNAMNTLVTENAILSRVPSWKSNGRASWQCSKSTSLNTVLHETGVLSFMVQNIP